MSHIMTARAMRQSGLRPAAKVVLYWLADHHNETTGDCFPSIERLAKLCEMSRRAVEQHLAQREAAGLITRQARRRPGGGKTSNAYTLRLTESDAQNLRIPSEKSAHGDAQNLRMINPVIDNLGIEKDTCVQDDFAEFWARYPRKIAKAKAQTFYAKARQSVTHDDIMSGLSRQMPELGATPQRYTPHPATWLKDERWKDLDIAPNATGKTDENFLEDWAARINGDDHLPHFYRPPDKIAERLIAEGRITRERLAARFR